MGAEKQVCILDPRLTLTGSRILKEAIKLSREHGFGVATVESVFASLLQHPRIQPVALRNGLEADSLIPIISQTRPQNPREDMLWDSEVEESLDHSMNDAKLRGARKAGLVGLLSVFSRHQAIRDLFFLEPNKINGLKALTQEFSNEHCYRREIAS